MYSNDQLCFSCAKACGNCSWSSQLIPVDGWIAENTVLPNGIESFAISKCPEYEFDGLCTNGNGDCMGYRNKYTTLKD